MIEYVAVMLRGKKLIVLHVSVRRYKVVLIVGVAI